MKPSQIKPDTWVQFALFGLIMSVYFSLLYGFLGTYSYMHNEVQAARWLLSGACLATISSTVLYLRIRLRGIPLRYRRASRVYYLAMLAGTLLSIGGGLLTTRFIGYSSQVALIFGAVAVFMIIALCIKLNTSRYGQH